MNSNDRAYSGGQKKPYPMSKTRRIAGISVFTAIVVLLQFLGSAIHVGPFSISLVLVPIVIGAALYGVAAGAWLGFVFGWVVLLSGDASLFLAVSIPGTVITVLVKGLAAGLGSGAVYKLFSKRSETMGVIMAAIAAPVCNTGVFFVGCLIFFMDTISGWAAAAGMENVGIYMVTAFVGLNFLLEMLINIFLSPVIVRLISAGRKIH